MIDSRPDGRILVTGATGLVGHEVLGRLLARGHRCAALVRGGASARERIDALLGELGLDPAALVADGSLVLVEGDLTADPPSGLPWWPDLEVRRVVHSAACTRFDAGSDGEPFRTNVEGGDRLLDWMERHAVAELHLLSTAYVCGRASTTVTEREVTRNPSFHNAYERSKWLAENAALRWARRTGARLTVHRPSIVVGDHATGRSSRFAGVYLSMRAGELLQRMSGGTAGAPPRHIPLRMAGDPAAAQDIVPVDWVADLVVAVVERPDLQGGIHHLTHPAPPTSAHIQRAIETFFDIAGGRFVPPAELDGGDLNEYERSFHALMQPLLPYVVDPPRFDRASARRLEEATGRPCPGWDEASLGRLIAYAVRSRWGRRPVTAVHRDHDCAVYFDRYLPWSVARSSVARLAGLSTTVRFVIEDVEDGQWVCRFEAGRLEEVHRGLNGLREDFAYRTDERSFWEIVSGTCDPQQVFLDGRAEITGDVEKALKMGMVLRAFNEEHPCDRRRLATDFRSPTRA